MELIILGSGSAAPSLERNCAGYVLKIDGKKILLDSGPGTMRRLLEMKISLSDIDHIFYTHLHNDHINDLGAIIWSNNYGLNRTKQLNIYGPNGIKEYTRILVNKILNPAKLYFGLNVKQLKDSKINIDNFSMETRQIKHSSTTRSVAYKIKFEGRTFVYTGDTEYCNETIEFAKNADALLTECSTPDESKIDGHLTPSLVGSMAKKANVKHLILTHFYPEVLKINIKKASSREFKGKITLARDKMKISI